MRLPWVPRWVFDLMFEQANRDREKASNAAFAMRLEYDALLNRYHALKLQGATLPEVVVPRERKEIDPLTQAVLDASRGKPPHIRNAMMKQLEQDRHAVELGHLEVSDVLRRIENGFASDDAGLPE